MKYLFIIILYCIPLFLKAQTPTAKAILENELPSKTVWCTIQDKLGYIWIATSNGLCRFDGTNLDIYTRKDGLWGDEITWLSETDDGNILVVSNKNKLALIHIENQPTIERIDPVPSHNYDVYLLNDILYSTAAILNKKEEKITPKEYFNKRFKRLTLSKTGDFYGTSQLGLFKYDRSSKTTNLIFKPNADENIYSMFYHNKTDCFIGSKNKIHHLKNDTLHKTISSNEIDNLVNYIIEYNTSSIIFNITNKGLFTYHLENEKIEPIHADLLDKHFNHLFKDKAGNIWCSSWGDGLYFIHKNKYKNYLANQDIKIKSISQFHFAEGSSYLGISSLNDFSVWKDNKERVIKTPKNKFGITNYHTIISDKNGNIYIPREETFKYNDIKPIKINSGDSELSISTLSNYFLKRCKQNLKDDTFYKTFKQDKKSLQYLFFNLEDNTSNILEITYPITLNLREFDKSTFLLDSLQIWNTIASDLYLFNREKNTLLSSKEDTTNFFPPNLKDVDIREIYSTHTDSIWFCTDKGLIGRINNEWLVFDSETPLKTDNINDLAYDEKNHLWLATNKGLIHYDYENFYHFHESHGLFESDMIFVEFDKKNKEVYVANVKGFAKAKKEEILDQFKINEKDLIIKNIKSADTLVNLNKPICIDSDNNKIEFEVAFLDFNIIGNTKFKYQLNNDKWSSMDNGKIAFQNLKNDDYQIKFRASKDGNTWVESKTMDFEVLPQWYQSWWFTILLGLTFMGLVGLISKIIITRNKKKAENEIALNKKIAFLEQKALTSSMNPHFIFNVLNSIQDFVQRKEVLETKHYIAKFGKLIRAYLDAAEKNLISLAQEIECVEQYLDLEKIRFEDDFIYEIDIDKDLETDLLAIPSMAIQPYVENAILHGILPKGKGALIIKLYEKNNQVYIQIIDNGIGITNSQSIKARNNNHLNMATKVTKERIRLFGLEHNGIGNIETLSTEKGTTVFIVIPAVSIIQ